MHREYDKCIKCKNFEYSKIKKNGWNGYCFRYNIKRMDESESCDYLIPVGE